MSIAAIATETHDMTERAAVLAHGLLGRVAVMHAAARTVAELGDRLERTEREDMLRSIADQAVHMRHELEQLVRGSA